MCIGFTRFLTFQFLVCFIIFTEMFSRYKKQETIGCCGIDCGLCPRFYTQGISTCPGCWGLHFSEKHPPCGILSCCAREKGLEVCSDCPDYPCKRFEPEKINIDSFVTHQRIFPNLDSIQKNGIEDFIVNQRIRMAVLQDLLLHYDEGRSKSFYCIACALLPIDHLREIQKQAHMLEKTMDAKEKSRIVKANALSVADSLKIELKLNKR